MIGKVHYNADASATLAKKELRKNYCSGAQALALYSSNFDSVSCLLCKNKHTKITTIKRRNKLVARLADAHKELAELRRVDALPRDPPLRPESEAAWQKRLNLAAIEVARYTQGIKDCTAVLEQLPAAGAPDHEEG